MLWHDMICACMLAVNQCNLHQSVLAFRNTSHDNLRLLQSVSSQTTWEWVRWGGVAAFPVFFTIKRTLHFCFMLSPAAFHPKGRWCPIDTFFLVFSSLIWSDEVYCLFVIFQPHMPLKLFKVDTVECDNGILVKMVIGSHIFFKTTVLEQ